MLLSSREPQVSKQKGRESIETKDTDNNTDVPGPVKACSTNVLRSYSSFCERLETSDLSPLVCARYGWENVDTDMLQCVGCKSFLSGQLPDKSDLPAYEESYSKLKKNLIASHDKFCVLAANPCPEHFCHVPIEDPTLLTAGFTERVNALKFIQDWLPCLELKNLQILGYDEGQSGAYCKRHLMPDCDTIPQVVTLAFTGWTYSMNGPNGGRHNCPHLGLSLLSVKVNLVRALAILNPVL
ncbi:Nuclear-interacting partner of ALK [Bulinus truncatus]|nr:Nuclear-interacting partner of ALK [Bulinus truncatus]